MEDVLHRMVKDATQSKNIAVRQASQVALDVLQDNTYKGVEPFQMRARCLTALQLAFESRNNKLETCAISGIQELLNEERFHSCMSVADDDDQQLPDQILDTLVIMPTLAENMQVDAMKLLLNMTLSPAWSFNTKTFVKMSELCVDCCLSPSNKQCIYESFAAAIVRLLRRFQQQQPHNRTSQREVLLDAYGANAQGSVRMAAKATLTQLLASITERMQGTSMALENADAENTIAEFTLDGVNNRESLTHDIVAILQYLCSKLTIALNSGSANPNRQVEPVLLEGIYAILHNLDVAICNDQSFINLVWQELCPTLISTLGNPVSDKSVVSQKAPLSPQEDVGRGSGCSQSAPSITSACAKVVYSIGVELIRLVSGVQSLRPVLQSLFHRILLYSAPLHRLDALRTLKETLSSTPLLVKLAGPPTVYEHPQNKRCKRNNQHTDLALLKLIIDSLQECSHCSDTVICTTSVDLMNELLVSIEQLMKGEGLSNVTAQLILHDYSVETESTPSAPDQSNGDDDAHYATSSDSEPDDSVHIKPTSSPLPAASRERSEQTERKSARQFIHSLQRNLPTFLAAESVRDVDEMLQKFASDFCSDLTKENDTSDIQEQGPALNADGVYLATLSALSLNVKLIHGRYYETDEKSLPITEMQFVDAILGCGLLLYLPEVWLSEVFHQLINTDLLATAGYTPATYEVPLIEIIIDLDGLDSREVGGQLLYAWRNISNGQTPGNSENNILVEAGMRLSYEILTVCWDGMLDVLSSVLSEKTPVGAGSSLLLMFTAREESERARQAICVALQGLQRAARMSCVLGLQDRCGAVFGQLAKASCVVEDVIARREKTVSSDSGAGHTKKATKLVRLHAAYALCMDALLGIGLEMASHSADCWKHVFRCCAHIAQLEHTYFSDGNNQRNLPRVQQEQSVRTNETYDMDENDTYGGLCVPLEPVAPQINVAELIQQSRIESGWDGSIAAGGVLSPAQASKVLCGLSQQVDRLFEEASEQLNQRALMHFLRELCESSARQLNARSTHGGPVTALHLHRLGTAVLRCATSRPLAHVMHAWRVVTPHLIQAACHLDRSVSHKAVTCLHETVTCFLSSSAHDEYAHFQFSEALCKPFETLLSLRLCDEDVQDQVVCSICALVEAYPSRIMSGWRALFAALRSVRLAYAADESVNAVRQAHVAAVLDVFDAFLSATEMEVFTYAAVDCILCLQKYVRGPGEFEDSDDSDSGSDLPRVTSTKDLCLPALKYLQQCCAILSSMWNMTNSPVFADADRIQLESSPKCVDPIIPNMNLDTVALAFHDNNPTSSDNSTSDSKPRESGLSPDQLGYTPTPLARMDRSTGVLRVWFLLLEGLGCTASACTKNFQSQIVQSLFEMLRSTADVPGADFCLYCVNHMLLPLLQQWLRRGSKLAGYWHGGVVVNNFKQCTGLATDLVVEFIEKFHGQSSCSKAVEFMLEQLLCVLIECIAQPVESLSRLGCACIRHCLISAAPVLTPTMWGSAVHSMQRACAVSLHRLRLLMLPFRVNSDNFYGDIGDVKVAVRRHCSGVQCRRIRRLAQQVFLLESQQSQDSEVDCMDLTDDDDLSYIFLIYPPPPPDDDSKTSVPERVPFSSLVVSLLSHQLLVQTIGAILLLESMTDSEQGSSGISPYLTTRDILSLLACLEDSHLTARAFDMRPGLKFLVQKVAGAAVACNLYRQMCASACMRARALIRACTHSEVSIFRELLSETYHSLCYAYIDLYLERVGPSPADVLSSHELVLLLAPPGSDDDVVERLPTLPSKGDTEDGMERREEEGDEMVHVAMSAPTPVQDPVDNIGLCTSTDVIPEETPNDATEDDDDDDDEGLTLRARDKEEDKVYEVATDQTIRTLMAQYKRRKQTQSMPAFVSATRSNPTTVVPATVAKKRSSGSEEDAEIEQEHWCSIQKDGEAQLGAWVSMLCELLRVPQSLTDDRQFSSLLPLVTPSVHQLICHSRDRRLRHALACWAHRIAHVYGFTPGGREDILPDSPPPSPS